MFDFTTAEYSVIGCILIDSRCLPAVRDVLPTAEVFASDHCRKAYAAICRLADTGQPVDPVTVRRSAALESKFLVECMDLTPTCVNVAAYARAVSEGNQRRQLGALGDKLKQDSAYAEKNMVEALNEARDALEALSASANGGAPATPRDSLKDFLDFRAEISAGKRQAVKTGFSGLDRILGGLAQGGLYIIAARPGVGKSAFGIALADMIAKSRTVLYVSLEMTTAELNARRVAAFSDASVSFKKLLFEQTTEAEDAQIVDACSRLSQRNLLLLSPSAMTVPELETQARNAKASVVFVDYLGLLTATGRGTTEYERITQISGALKRLAKRLGCVVIALCQLNRESTIGGGDSRPKLSQLRSSGAIEQDADGVLLLHRPEYGKQESTADPPPIQQFFVDVAKNRHGRTGTAQLTWYAPVNRFEAEGDRWSEKSWT